MAKRTHIRRCHVCGEVTESKKSTVEKCSSCGKHLAPFYFFDESQMDGIAEFGYHVFRMDAERPGKKVEAYYQPIWGLTAFW